METTITTVEGLISIIESGKGGCVSLSRCQLADLFGVYYGTITANIKVLIKSGAVNPSFKGTVVQVGQTVIPECYDMEMVIALAFRLITPAAEKIRRYVVERTMQQPQQYRPPISVFVPVRNIPMSGNTLPNRPPPLRLLPFETLRGLHGATEGAATLSGALRVSGHPNTS